MEASDTLLLADLVEYELLPLLANFHQSANELAA
jgi:hypothetical protein